MSQLINLVSALLDIFEGCKLIAYQDTGGVWTIGYGHTGPEVKAGYTITKDIAIQLMTKNIMPLVNQVSNNVGWSVAKQAGYVDFGYNCGSGALNKVLQGLDSIDNPRHCTDKLGNVLSYLQKRRNLEAQLIQL